MKKRWKIALGAGGVLLGLALAPILYIETACRSPLPGLNGGAYASVMAGAQGRRPEARTWLTFPEWYIVYSAESYGGFLASGGRPSAFSYGREIKTFWTSLCSVNRTVAGAGGSGAGGGDADGGAGDAKVMLYTIGLSFSAEMAVKAAYEKSLGRIAEWIGGWSSADDAYAAGVWQRYGAFMHETPWYEFPFGETFSGLWETQESDGHFRHWERRLALSAEYGVKAGYAGLIGWASGAALGADEKELRFVASADPEAIRKVDTRLRPVGVGQDGLVTVQAPRYAQFTDLLLKLSATPVALVEIAGNDDIFLTVLLPSHVAAPRGTVVLMDVPRGERIGRRVGLSVKVPRLLPLLREVRAAGGTVEHVYDY